MTDEGKPVEDELLQVPGDMVGLVHPNWQKISHQSFVCGCG